MMRWFWSGLALSLLVGCLPIPQIQTELVLPPVHYRSSPLTVETDYVTVEGYPEPHTPEAYNKSAYLRYYRSEDSLDTVFILMPGIFGGATSVDILARLLVASTPGLEVWALDRRANALEDRSGFVRALEARDPTVAYDYYLAGEDSAEGFRPLDPAEVPFMGYWGLEVHLRDLHEVVTRANARAPRVVLGGHSLGASLASFYAAYHFGPAQGAGYQHIDGLVLIDGALGRTGGFGIDPALTTRLGILPDIAGLEAAVDAPFLTFGFSARAYAEREVAALLARFRPLELSPGGFFDFPVTNRAALALLQDDTFGPVTIFASSLGEVVGAELGGNLGAFLTGGRIGAHSSAVVNVAEGYDYVDWKRGDPKLAHTDLTAIARAWSTLDSNRAEWYFPLRLALDIGEADLRFDGSGAFVAGASVLTPTLAVGAARGLVNSPEIFAAYGNTRPGSFFSSYILPDLTHLDIVEASDNPFVPLFKLWLEQID